MLSGGPSRKKQAADYAVAVRFDIDMPKAFRAIEQRQHFRVRLAVAGDFFTQQRQHNIAGTTHGCCEALVVGGYTGLIENHIEQDG